MLRESSRKTGEYCLRKRQSPVHKRAVLVVEGTQEEIMNATPERMAPATDGNLEDAPDIIKTDMVDGVHRSISMTPHSSLDVESLDDAQYDVMLPSEDKPLNKPGARKQDRSRKRKSVDSQEEPVRYYDRYKHQDYVKRNDCAKYCQICRKKVIGKLRSLPSEHRLRRIWILRFNLDAERSAELWVREAFSDSTHCGEACPIHFPIGSENLKSSEVLPLDMRQDPGNYSMQEDKTFDFDSLELECVYCNAKNTLRNMVPFSRARNRRYKWINALTGEQDSESKTILCEKLKNGSSKFLCDWHFCDTDFDINQFGEWRLRKDAIPDATLCENDKQANRVYLVNHGDTILSRSFGTRSRRDEMMLLRRDMSMSLKDRSDRSHYRYMTDKLRRTYPRRMYVFDREEFNYDADENFEDDPNTGLVDEIGLSDRGLFVEQNQMARLGRPCSPQTDAIGTLPAYQEETSGSKNSASDQIDYSDDSDEELSAINRVEQLSCEPVMAGARFCQVCSRVISSNKSMLEHKPRTWPFDDVKHEKWLEIMNWPREFEDSMRVLWVKRRNDLLHNGTYHFCPINVCQNHLDFRNLHNKVNAWLQTYCILCDEDIKDPNLLVPFPAERCDRVLWVHSLINGPPMNKLVERRWKWLKERLTRPKATRYRLCVYHFDRDAFVEKEDCIEFNQAAVPLPLGLSEYDITPRGPQGLVKCPLCDMWGTEEELVEIRSPSTRAERLLLVEILSGDKTMMKKGVEQLAITPCKICKTHLPSVDPYSIIAERRLVSHVEIQCVQCNNRDLGANMIPFPMDDPNKKNFWVEALCRDHFSRVRLLKRLELEGRHYLCTAHFHKNSLRYIPDLGVWKRFVYTPLAMTAADRARLMRLHETESQYHPLLIAGLDDDGVVLDVSYDEVSALLGEHIESMYSDQQNNDRGSQYEAHSKESAGEVKPCEDSFSSVVGDK